MAHFLKAVVFILLLGLVFTGQMSIGEAAILLVVYLVIEAVIGALITAVIGAFSRSTYRRRGYGNYADRVSHSGYAGRQRMNDISDEYVRNVRDTLRR